MFKQILLATDGSLIMERVIIYVAHLAHTETADITVVHAYQPPEQYANYDGYTALRQQYHSVAQAVVDDMVQALRADGVRAHGEVHIGPAADVIIGVAAAHNVDLIILGTRGSGNLAAMLGSVSTHVLRAAACPVLVIP